MEIIDIYSLVVEGIVITLLLIRTFSYVFSVLYTHSHYYLLTHLIYARLCGRISRLRTVFRYNFLLQSVYFCGTLVCNLVGVHNLPQAGFRAARVAVVNLVPLFFSGSHSFGAHLLGISLRTYQSIHSTVGLMVVIQGVVHAVISLKSTSFSFSYGPLVSDLAGVGRQ